jgi:hypothetical protein
MVSTLPDASHLFPEISAPKKRAFLSAFAQLGRREAAAAAIGIDPRTHRYWMQKDAVYVEAFKRAEGFVADRIEDEIFRRGVEGVERSVWYNGVQVGTERHSSDTLLIFAAKGARPEKYRDNIANTHEVSPTMAVLLQQWQALRDAQQPPSRALPEQTYDVEGEVSHEPGLLLHLPPPRQDDFRQLYEANQALDDEPEPDDERA